MFNFLASTRKQSTAVSVIFLFLPCYMGVTSAKLIVVEDLFASPVVTR